MAPTGPRNTAPETAPSPASSGRSPANAPDAANNAAVTMQTNVFVMRPSCPPRQDSVDCGGLWAVSQATRRLLQREPESNPQFKSGIHALARLPELSLARHDAIFDYKPW